MNENVRMKDGTSTKRNPLVVNHQAKQQRPLFPDASVAFAPQGVQSLGAGIVARLVLGWEG